MLLDSAKNTMCGSPPSVFLRAACASADGTGAARYARSEKDADIYNIYALKPGTKPKGKPRRTKNRKYILRGDTVERAGTEYAINNGKSGIYSRIIHRAIDELDKSIALWVRVFVLRFDLHHTGIQRADNKYLSRLFQNLKRRIDRAYGLHSVGYCWVREQEKGKAQHYHAVVYLDGDVIRHPAKLRGLISDTWEAINPVNTVYYPENQYYFIDSEEVKRDVVYRVSYMAKSRGKGCRDNQVKDFFCSNLRVMR